MSTDLNKIKKEPVNNEMNSNNVDNPLLNESKEQSNEINSFPRMKFIRCIVSNVALCLLYYFDIISDILVMNQYFKEERYAYFTLTLLFILIPWFIMIFYDLAKDVKEILAMVSTVFCMPFIVFI